jgi:hypothetical protein
VNIKVRKIEVDAETADLLEARAAARGMSVAELLADIACNDEVLPADLGEMRARGEFERTRMGVPWEEIRAWMESWGTRSELPTPKPRKL